MFSSGKICLPTYLIKGSRSSCFETLRNCRQNSLAWNSSSMETTGIQQVTKEPSIHPSFFCLSLPLYLPPCPYPPTYPHTLPSSIHPSSLSFSPSLHPYRKYNINMPPYFRMHFLQYQVTLRFTQQLHVPNFTNEYTHSAP